MELPQTVAVNVATLRQVSTSGGLYRLCWCSHSQPDLPCTRPSLHPGLGNERQKAVETNGFS